MNTTKTAFDQMTETEIGAVGLLVGIDTPGPSFRNALREMPPLEGGWTMGQMAVAYLDYQRAYLFSASA